MKETLTFRDKIVLFPIWLVTLLPLPLLYLFSDLVFFILYYILRYRRAVVHTNLTRAFPDKTERDIRRLTIKFYRYLCDYFIESIYLLNMSAAESNKRYRYTNPDVMHELYKKKKNIVFAVGHYGNWEWATANIHVNTSYYTKGIYKPLSNKMFDRLFFYIRARYGNIPVPMKQTLRVINGAIRNKEIFSIYLVADQRPTPEDLHYWTIFLNQDTPVISGVERISRKYDMPVVFLDIDRPKRGHYDVTFKVLTEDPKNEPQFAITEKYIRHVENMIIRKPELWPHKRWKYSAEKHKPKATS